VARALARCTLAYLVGQSLMSVEMSGQDQICILTHKSNKKVGKWMVQEATGSSYCNSTGDGP
jgi:hypothetical protein